MVPSSIQKLSVIIPCFNEAGNVERYPRELFPPINTVAPTIEYIVIDDGSTDSTYATALALQQKYPNVVVVRHDKNKGLGAAVRTGIAHATGDAILTLDSDLTFPPSEVERLIQSYVTGADAVFGSPFKGSFDDVPLIRKLMSTGVNLVYQLLLWQRLTAISSIFRLYRASSVKSLSLENTSFDINAEIAFKLIRAKAKILEVPATLKTRTIGISKINTLKEITNHLRIFKQISVWRFQHLSKKIMSRNKHRTHQHLIIIKGWTKPPKASPATKVHGFDEIKNKIRTGELVKELFHYDDVVLLTYRITLIAKPFLTLLLMFLLSRGTAFIEDETGARQRVDFLSLLGAGCRALRDTLKKPVLLYRIRDEIAMMRSFSPTLTLPPSGPLFPSKQPVYLRTDFSFGLISGGSVGHIAGVLNALDHFGEKPIFITTDQIPTVREDLETHIHSPSSDYADFNEIRTLAFMAPFFSQALSDLGRRPPAFFYQRYSRNDFSGLKLAGYYGVPLVLEYNGSETWISQHWDSRLKYEKLTSDIELLNLHKATMVVVVSDILKEELVTRGIDGEKILVNPNGVNTEKYHPDLSGQSIRQKIKSPLIIGFIGTFGLWHGTLTLMQAASTLFRTYPDLKEQVIFLMVGDGPLFSKTKHMAFHEGIQDQVVFTGLIPQNEGATYMAACDILVAPHVPNPDGSAFFGSPTKLFEYMALGKAIVASDLDQIGDVLQHDETAWLVKPGDADDLMRGLKALIDAPEKRKQLGAAARQQAVACHTWEKHTQTILQKLSDILQKHRENAG